MNYISEIRAFYDLVQTKGLSAGQISLWNGLMHLCNKTGWKDRFNVPNVVLQVVTGLSRSAILKNRNVLKELGLIDFQPNETKATTYMMKSVQDSAKNSKHDEEEPASKNTPDSNQENMQNAEPMSKSVQSNKQDGKQSSTQDEEFMSKSAQDSVQNSGTYINTNTNNIKKGGYIKRYTNSPSPNPYARKFVPPTVDEVRAYCQERGNHVNPERFVHFYAQKGWMVGRNEMTDWKEAIQNWEMKEDWNISSHFTSKQPAQSKRNQFCNFTQRDTDYDQLIAGYYGYVPAKAVM